MPALFLSVCLCRCLVSLSCLPVLRLCLPTTSFRSRPSLLRRTFRFGGKSADLAVLNNRQLLLGSTFWREGSR